MSAVRVDYDTEASIVKLIFEVEMLPMMGNSKENRFGSE